MTEYLESLEVLMEEAWETELAFLLDEIADDLLFGRVTFGEAIERIKSIRLLHEGKTA